MFITIFRYRSKCATFDHMDLNKSPVSSVKLLNIISVAAGLTLLIAWSQSCINTQDEPIIGAKIYEHQESFEQLFDQWDELGINTAFCSEELISKEEFREQAKEHDNSTFVIFPVFFKPEALKNTPELYAITHTGEVAREEGVECVCPSQHTIAKRWLNMSAIS